MSATPSRVLIVDDDAALRALLTELIEDSGFVAFDAIDGQEALQVLRQQGERPCLILLDLMMPVMNGWEFRQAQLADPGLAPIPVVVISARSDLTASAQTLAAQAYLSKPVDIVQLQQLVLQHCA
ncbi:MAG: response regulator [Chloroflexales bacterium]|nr:response regulator [Chloroflexales bacterium]